MRTLLLLASLVVAAAVVALVLARDERSSPQSQPVGAVTLVGDSLNVGIEPYLPVALEGWTITNRNEIGRPTSVGLDVLRAEGKRLAPRVVVSLGTNDALDAVNFRRQVREALAIAGPRRCVVWVNMAVDWRSFAGFNDVLEQEAARVQNLHIVDWAGLLGAHPNWLAADGVHGTEAGYQGRADAVADAVRSCRVEPELQPAP